MISPRTVSCPVWVRLLRLICLLFGMGAGVALANPDRPNILWLVSEDNSPRFVGAYGDPLARTPHLDDLAREGVVFDRVYAVAPVCAPSRSSIITGRYAHGLGTQHMRSARPLPQGTRFFPEWLREAGYFCTNNAKTDYNTSTEFAAAWDENGRHAHWRQRKPGQPFFAVFNFEQSHESALHQRRSLTTDTNAVVVPPHLPDRAAIRADLAQYYDSVSRMDEAVGRILAQLEADGLAESTIVFYYADNGGAVAGTKRFPNEGGTRVPLIVRFPARFAALSPVPAGQRSAELISLLDLAPTVLSLAGVPLPGQFDGRAFAGPRRSPAPAFTFMLRDRMDERYDLSRAVTDGRFRYLRNYRPELPWGRPIEYLWQQAAMREWADVVASGLGDARHRAFFQPKPVEELYEVQTDPDQTSNLAGDPRHRERLETMRQALREHQLAVRDTGLMPEPMMVALASGASPTAVAGDEAQYPIEMLLDLIDRVQLGDEGAAELLESAAKHASPVMRYWATQLSNAPELLRILELDTDPVVRVTAASRLLRKRVTTESLAVVEPALARDGLEELQLFTLNALEDVPVPALELLAPALRRVTATASEKGLGPDLVKAAGPLLAKLDPASDAKRR
jgi:Arylsulfatase A and related enzymes